MFDLNELNGYASFALGVVTALVAMLPKIMHLLKVAESYTKEGTKVDNILDRLIVIGGVAEGVFSEKNQKHLLNAISEARSLSFQRVNTKHSPRVQQHPSSFKYESDN